MVLEHRKSAAFRQPFWHLTTLGFGCSRAGMNANLVTDAKFAFVVAEKKGYVAGADTETEMQWRNFLGNVQRIVKLPEGMQTIHENVWLIPLATGLPFLTKLIDWSGSFGVSIRILFLEEAPNWIQYPPDAEAKPS